MGTSRVDRAVELINRRGMLLVYPIDQRDEPRSLWSEFHPRTPMRWEWDEGGDDRVARLWHLREELSRSGRVVYGKWFRGRATFFSRNVFGALLAALGSARAPSAGLGREARELLAALELESPQSTKELKRAVGLTGRAAAGAYERGLKELWLRGLVVGYGEREDGAFPSLLVGATSLLFEDIWASARELDPDEGERVLTEGLGENSLFLGQYRKLRDRLRR